MEERSCDFYKFLDTFTVLAISYQVLVSELYYQYNIPFKNV